MQNWKKDKGINPELCMELITESIVTLMNSEICNKLSAGVTVQNDYISNCRTQRPRMYASNDGFAGRKLASFDTERELQGQKLR